MLSRFAANIRKARQPDPRSALFVGGPYEGYGSPCILPAAAALRKRPGSGAVRGNAAETACATKILSTLARRAYRRSLTSDDVRLLIGFYRSARAQGDFDAGIRAGIEMVLVSPDFLFRISRDPAGAAPGTAYALPDVELASRLSFFLWSSIPDDDC